MPTAVIPYKFYDPAHQCLRDALIVTPRIETFELCYAVIVVQSVTVPSRKSHKPTCQAAQAASPSTSRDSISKLTERVDVARYQQSRAREFSSFIGPQDVIITAEKSYKDAMRDAETLLRCEPEYNDEAVNDENWIDARWEWVDVCEKILGKAQAALQTLNMFHKKLEVPPILVGSGGSFVGQSKKTVNELKDKYAESTEDLEVSEAEASVSAGALNPCSRCRARGTICDGKKGRACAPCKKAKLSCNFSSARVPASKSKVASKKPAGTNIVAPAILTLPRTSERSSTPTQRKLKSWADGLGVTNVDSDQPAAGPSKSKSISAPVIQNGVMVQERPNRAVKRKRSFDSSEPKNSSESTEPNDTTIKDQPAAGTAAVQLLPPNDIPCERCKATGKVCVGPVGRPCVQCKKVKLGCSFSNPKKTSKAPTSTLASASTSTSTPASVTPAAAVASSATASASVPMPAPTPIIQASNKNPRACQRCKEEDRICIGPKGLACIACKKSNTKCTTATVTEHQPRPRSAPLMMPPVPALIPSTPLPPLPPVRAPPIPAASPARTSATASKLGSSSADKPATFDFQAEFSEPCYYCNETGASCWGLKDFESASGRPKPGSSCWRCLEANKMCSKRLLHASATPGPSQPPSRESSMAVEPIQLPWTTSPIFERHSSTANLMRNPAMLLHDEKQANPATPSHPSRMEVRTPNANNHVVGVKQSKRTLTLLGPKSAKGPRARLPRCQQCEISGSKRCPGPPGQACGTCTTLQIECSRIGPQRHDPLPGSLPRNRPPVVVGQPVALKRKAPPISTSDAVDMPRVEGLLDASSSKIHRVADLLGSDQSTKRPRIDEANTDAPQTNGTTQQSSNQRPVATIDPTEHILAGQLVDFSRPHKMTLIVPPKNKPATPLHHVDDDLLNTNGTAASANIANDIAREDEEKRRTTMDLYALAS